MITASRPGGRGRNSTRTSTACEYCRTTRVRCQPSDQPGVCARCLSLKRECVSRIKSRPQRRVRTTAIRGLSNTNFNWESPGHLGTFTINYTVPVRLKQHDPLPALHDIHSRVFGAIPHGQDSKGASKNEAESCGILPTSKLLYGSDINCNVWRQPLFDVASAEILLRHFQSTISYLPIIHLPSDITVARLNATKPFVLLAILTVASGATMVTKHTLYEDEFRKALALKHVSGGERGLELLQGILIYCAWYPFHLRLKNEQLVHYLRTASDLIHDIHIDECLDAESGSVKAETLDDNLEKLRVYLAYIYLMLTWAVLWRGLGELPITQVSWASTCAQALQSHARVNGDYILACLVQLSTLFSCTTSIIREPDPQAATGCQSLLADLQDDYSRFQETMQNAGFEAIKMQAMFIDIFLDCGGLLNFPVARAYSTINESSSYPPLPRLYGAIKKIRLFLDYVEALPDSSVLSFTINDWTRLIAILTLAFRLSFPLPLCPGFSSQSARSVLCLDTFLSEMSRDTLATSVKSDLLSASRSVLSLAKEKYSSRLATLQGPKPGRSFSRAFGCPVIAGTANLRQS